MFHRIRSAFNSRSHDQQSATAFSATTASGYSYRQSKPRQLYINIPMPEERLDSHSFSLGHYRPVDHYVTNQICTAKYTLLTFVPKNLFEQFRRVANSFFLLLVILQAFPEFATINVGIVAMPIIFIVAVTALKDAVEDFKRWKNDRAVNERTTMTLNGEAWHNMNYPASMSPQSPSSLLRDGFMAALKLSRQIPTDKNQENHIIPNSVASDSPTSQPTTWKETMWRDIRVGDIIYLKNDEPIPADIIILSTSETDNICYIETKNLDGETNLKLRQGPAVTSTLKTADDCVRKLRLIVDSEPPSVNLLRYNATLSVSIEDRGIPELPRPKKEKENMTKFTPLISKSTHTSERMSTEYGLRKLAIDINGILLRGAILRNTKWVIGIVVFTGQDSKQVMNSGITPSKRSRVDRMMNPHVGINLILMLLLCTVSAIGYSIWLQQNTGGTGYFLFGITYDATYDAFLNFWAALILYQNIVPISLYITIEFVKTLQAYFIHADIQMYYPPNDTPCSPRSWNLSDDLGQIEYIFSDKTGTLTRNIMEFKKCSIGGVLYDGTGKSASMASELNSAVPSPLRKGHQSRKSGFSFQADWVEGVPDHHGKNTSNSSLSTSTDTEPFSGNVLWSDPALNDYIDDPTLLKTEHGVKIRDFFSLLSVCHTVLVDDQLDGSETKTISYKAQSPDEACLVTIAAETGFVFKKRGFNSAGKNEIMLDILGQEERFVLLNVIEFDSDRKRMSVIVKPPNNDTDASENVILFCKGADSVIFERLAPGQEKIQRRTTRHLESFAEEGLRTLCLAFRKIPIQSYENWARRYQDAITIIYPDPATRAFTLEKLNSEIEEDLLLLGATAIEDKLQEGVPECISTLSAAGIKIWVLTGDKVETAINIGFLCGLLKTKLVQNGVEYVSDLSLIQIRNAKGDEDVERMIESALRQFWTPDGSPNNGEKYALIIDGQSLKFALDNEGSKNALLDLACRCTAVVCCRVSPLQKAKVVDMVKTGKKVMTLAIGDGANDAADVGVGISGEEGMQAAMSSDYAIAQFAFLTRLLLVHGRWSYSRMAFMILNFYLKSGVFTIVIFWFQFFCGFSSSIIYDYTYMLFYNTVFTCLPIAVLAVFDQDVEDTHCIRFPQLYGSEGITRSLYTHKRFFIYLGEAVWHSLVCFFVCIWSLSEVSTSADGKSTYGILTGTAMAASAILNVNLSVALDNHSWNWMAHVLIWGTSLIFFVYLIIFAAIPGASLYGALGEVYGNPAFWLSMILCVALSLGPRFLFYYVQRQFKPTDSQIISEMQLLAKKPAQKKGSTVARSSDSVKDNSNGLRLQLRVTTDLEILENSSEASPKVIRKRNSNSSITSVSYSMQTGAVSKPHGFSFSHTKGMGNIVLRSPMSMFPPFSAFSRPASRAGTKAKKSKEQGKSQSNERVRQPSENTQSSKKLKDRIKNQLSMTSDSSTEPEKSRQSDDTNKPT